MKIIRINAIWCSGCLSQKKVWKEINKEYPNLDITVYDYDLDNDTVSKYNPGKILPVVIFSNDGKEKRLIGEVSKKEIIDMLLEMGYEK